MYSLSSLVCFALVFFLATSSRNTEIASSLLVVMQFSLTFLLLLHQQHEQHQQNEWQAAPGVETHLVIPEEEEEEERKKRERKIGHSPSTYSVTSSVFFLIWILSILSLEFL